jgi:hypothetical protein
LEEHVASIFRGLHGDMSQKKELFFLNESSHEETYPNAIGFEVLISSDYLWVVMPCLLEEYIG